MAVVVRKENRLFSFGRILFVFSLLFILATIPLVVLYVKDKTLRDSRGQAAEVSVNSLNSEIEKNISGGRLTENTFLLTQRNEEMQTLAATNPQAFLQNAYTSSQRERFSENQRGLIEEQKQITGKLVEVYKENLANKKYEKNYLIQNSEGTYGLKTVSALSEEQAKSGRDVTVSGIKISNLIVATNDAVNISGNSVSTASNYNSKNYLVIPINFIGDRRKPYSKDEIRNKLFESSSSSSNYLKNVTENKYFINGTIASWQESNIKKSTVCDNADQLTDYAYKNFPVNNYYGVIFVFPKLGDCWWAGMGSMEGSPKILWLNYFDQATITHELGHNIGIQHAATLSCDSRGCKADEYGDLSDTMGYQFGNLNGPHRIGLGAMIFGGVRVFSGNNTYTIKKLGGSATPQVLKINDPGSNTDIYVEYRGSNSSYSKDTPYDLDAGVLIYRWDGNRASKSYLIDISPTDGKANNLVLRDGRQEIVGPVIIKQISHDNNSAKIRVERR